MVHDILEYEHIQWHPQLITHQTNGPCYWIGPDYGFGPLLNSLAFHRTVAKGAACQQRTLTPPDIWSCPNLRLVYFLTLRPIPPKPFLFQDFWSSSIPRYFFFTCKPCCDRFCDLSLHNKDGKMYRQFRLIRSGSTIRVWYASRERLPFRTPGSIPLFGTCLCSYYWVQIPRPWHVFTRHLTFNTPWYFLDFA